MTLGATIALWIALVTASISVLKGDRRRKYVND